MTTTDKKCEQCDELAVKGERFCKACRKVLFDKLQSTGYFAPAPRLGSSRASEQKENTYETKHGTGHG